MENENLEEKVVDVMEEAIKETPDIAVDSGLTQLKYYFTSWTKYFESIAVKPRFLVFIGLILVFVLAMTPFREPLKELTIEGSRVTLEETFNNSALYQDFSDDDIEALIEQTLKATENMYSAPIFILTNVMATAMGILLTFTLILIVLKILKSDVTPMQMLAVTIGATVISTIASLVYTISIGFTGSLTNITSLGIFVIGAPVTSPQYLILNSISIASVITFIFYYFMGIALLKYSKNKSMIVSLVLIIIPMIVTIVPTMLTSMLL